MARKKFRFRSFFFKEQGLSLIELMIVSSLLLTVLALAYNFWHFGFSSFVSAEQRSDVQQNVRLATDFINSEIRFAASAELLDATAVPAAVAIAADTHYILLNGSAIEYRARNVSQVIPQNLADNIRFSLNFSKTEISNDLLSVVVSGAINDQPPYSLSSQIRLENLRHFNRTITGSTTGTAVRFVRQTINLTPSLSVQPNAVVAGMGFNQTFTLALLNDTFSESFGIGNITLGGAFSELTVYSANRTGSASASVTLSGNLIANSGSGQILVDGSGLAGGSALSAQFSVVPDAIFTLNILRSGNGSTTPAVGSHPYPQGATATLDATATAPWQFRQWQIGSDIFFSAQLTVLMDSNKTATARFRRPLTGIPGGSYVSHNGFTYLKLTGANNRVMNLSLRGYGNWHIPSSPPSRSELEGGVWTNSLRIAGVNAYWTDTEHNANRGVYVSSAGAFAHDSKNDTREIREARTLLGILFAYSGTGTREDPFILGN